MEENPNQDPSATTAADATSTTTTNLNDLSQDILLHILSFLPTLESITTSLISKKWKSLWSLVPSLNFSYVHFPIYKSFFTTRQFFSEFVDRTLILRPHLPLQKFRLEFIYEDRYGCHVDSWVRYAIRNRVSELDLDFFIDESFHIVELEGRRDYDFPFSAPRNGKVRVLKLCRCDLTLPADMESMNLWSMKEIFFYQIYMTDDMVLNLLKACPNIEVLKLENCYGMENLRLCSEKLKRLGLSSFYTAERELYLELDCPNLVWLGIDCVETGEFCIKNLSSLIEFCTSIAHKTEHYGHWFKVVKQLHRIAHIKHLVVQNWWRKLAAKDGIPKDFLLHNLKHLELQTGYTQYDLLGMAALLELCPNLETMILDPLYKIDDDESLSEELLNKPIHFSIPSLKEVKLKVIPGENQNQIVQFVALLKKQGVVLDKIVLVPLYSGISVSRRRSLRAEVNE
uniref:F-box domain-containing protein n=1 Tax=Salix viminalis TaxID=40686 RepID=A0A6N2LXT8_SALVM